MEKKYKKGEDSRFIPMTSVSSGKGREARSDVFYYTNQIVNVIMVGQPGEKNWVLVDAGLPKAAGEIQKEAAKRFGEGNGPSFIILTHGHFDHVGSLVDLLKVWDVPVFAHRLEHAFLQGMESYPTADSSVEGGGLLAKISQMYPRKPIDITPALHSLPEDHTVPGMPGWRWLHTSGHSRGHVSFYRDEDRTLIAGDAFVTVRQDAMYNVLVQKDEVNGPPNYLTVDWDAAGDSVKVLNDLKPNLAVCGHGSAMEGESLQLGLDRLAREFQDVIPKYGKFVENE